jgi:hypothetical protein
VIRVLAAYWEFRADFAVAIGPGGTRRRHPVLNRNRRIERWNGVEWRLERLFPIGQVEAVALHLRDPTGAGRRGVQKCSRAPQHPQRTFEKRMLRATTTRGSCTTRICASPIMSGLNSTVRVRLRIAEGSGFTRPTADNPHYRELTDFRHMAQRRGPKLSEIRQLHEAERSASITSIIEAYGKWRRQKNIEHHLSGC